MDRVYQSNAVGTPPAVTPSSGAYPTAGNKSVGQLATVPGPYWFYSITEEIRNAIVAAGLTPDPAQVNQLATAMAKYLPLSGGAMTGHIITDKSKINHILLSGGVGWSEGDASLYLYNANAGDNHGAFQLVAGHHENFTALEGMPDGTLKWGGKNVACVERWRSSTGTSWYRKWSDGWIEQGGIASGSNLANGSSITLPIPFTSLNYSTLLTPLVPNGGTQFWNGNPPTRDRTSTTSVLVWGAYGGGSGTISWYACGI